MEVVPFNTREERIAKTIQEEIPVEVMEAIESMRKEVFKEIQRMVA